MTDPARETAPETIAREWPNPETRILYDWLCLIGFVRVAIQRYQESPQRLRVLAEDHANDLCQNDLTTALINASLDRIDWEYLGEALTRHAR